MHFITIVISVFALAISVRSCEIAEKVPVKVAVYQSRSNALSTYGEAFQRFSNFLRRAHLNSVFGGPPAERIRNASAAEFDAFGIRAQEALMEYEDYISAVNKSREPWPLPVQNSIIHAGDDAREAVGCYLLFQNWANREVLPSLDDRKHDALIACKTRDDTRKNFEAASNESIRQMNDLVKAALSD